VCPNKSQIFWESVLPDLHWDNYVAPKTLESQSAAPTLSWIRGQCACARQWRRPILFCLIVRCLPPWWWPHQYCHLQYFKRCCLCRQTKYDSLSDIAKLQWQECVAVAWFQPVRKAARVARRVQPQDTGEWFWPGKQKYVFSSSLLDWLSCGGKSPRDDQNLHRWQNHFSNSSWNGTDLHSQEGFLAKNYVHLLEDSLWRAKRTAACSQKRGL
jgi:hypothetical protein